MDKHQDFNEKRLYVMYDLVAQETVGIPHVFRNDQHAIRMLADVVKAPGTGIHEHPNDYVLMAIASFNSQTGQVLGFEPERVINCGALVIPSGNSTPQAVSNV